MKKYASSHLLPSISILFLCACSNTPKGSKTESRGYDYTEDSIEQLAEIPDTVSGEAVEHKCAIMSYQLDEIIDEMELIKSPYQLMKFRSQYPNLLRDATEGESSLSAHDREILNEKIRRVKELYTETGRKYEVDAFGVLEQLNTIADKMRSAKTKEEVEDCLGSYYVNIENLDIVHLSVNQNQNVSEIQRKARLLKGIINEKKRQFSIN